MCVPPFAKDGRRNPLCGCEGEDTVNEITKKGQMILQCLKQNAQSHMTAEAIADFLKKENAAVSAATIYRQLDKLVCAGVVRKYVTSPEEPACFQYSESENAACTRHFHLKCTSCGKLFHVSCPYLAQLEAHILSHHGFAVDHTRTVLYGVCESCVSASAAHAEAYSDGIHDSHTHKEDDSHET